MMSEWIIIRIELDPSNWQNNLIRHLNLKEN